MYARNPSHIACENMTYELAEARVENGKLKEIDSENEDKEPQNKVAYSYIDNKLFQAE